MGKGKIGKDQLSDSLLALISRGGNNTVDFRKNSVTINKPTNSVIIGINGFDKDEDLLMVYRNTVYLEEGSMYNISSDSVNITNPNGSWSLDNTNSLFNFIVIKSGLTDNNAPRNSYIAIESVEDTIPTTKEGGLYFSKKDKKWYKCEDGINWIPANI